MKSTIPTLALAAVAAVIVVLRAGLSFTQTNDVSYLTEADVRVQESDPERNYAHRGLWTGGSASDHKESYLCFRLSVVGGAVESAKLRVYSYDGTEDGPAVYETTDDWSEYRITWANRPPTVGPEIDDAGPVTRGSWVEYDVSGVVDGDGTYSFVLRSASADIAKFDAWEGSHQPELVVSVEGDPIIVGAGDIASGETKGDASTAELLDTIPGTVFTVGDDAYESGSIEDFQSYYEPSWGRHQARTKPSTGNHEYVGGDPQQYGRGYFDYFGAVAAEDNGGSYSYNLGEWHIVSLNTGQCYGSPEADGSIPNCGPGDPMIEWLKRDLATNGAQCTLAYFHHPRWSSGIEHGSEPSYTKAIWDTLYADNAEVVVSGHDHDYERFAPQDLEGNLDEERGIRQFVVGTGGRSLRDFGEVEANSKVRNSETYGVIKVTLHSGSYDWEFIPIDEGAFTDAGSDRCH